MRNNRNDVDVYLEAARLTERYDYQKAINYYNKALEILEKQVENQDKKEEELTENDFVNPVYYNNLAVLYIMKDQREKASEMLVKARDILNKVRKTKPSSIRLKSISITLYFNEALQLETLGNIGEATNLYKYIIKQEPNYSDAYLRLAILASQRGSHPKAIEYAEKASKYQLDKNSPIPYLVLGNFYTDAQQYSKAEKEFMKVLNKNQFDSYAHVSIGNLIYDFSCTLRSEPEKQETKLREALNRYRKGLEYDDSNAYAALGIANIIGEYGLTREASEMYRTIDESHPSMPHAIINRAHILASQGELLNALRLYEKTLEKHYGGKNDEIEMWIARLRYETKDYEGCKKALKNIMK